jgi:hypothetical protein
VNPTPANFPLPANDDGSWPVGRTYLRQPGMQITDRWFVITGQRYEVSQLRSARTIRGAYDPTVATTAAIAGAALLAVLVSAHVFKSEPAVWLGAAVLALIPASVAVAAWRLHPRPFELWADYRGVPVRLFGCPDEKTYGHVTRALIRAQEAQRPQRPLLPQDTRVHPPAA